MAAAPAQPPSSAQLRQDFQRYFLEGDPNAHDIWQESIITGTFKPGFVVNDKNQITKQGVNIIVSCLARSQSDHKYDGTKANIEFVIDELRTVLYNSNPQVSYYSSKPYTEIRTCTVNGDNIIVTADSGTFSVPVSEVIKPANFGKQPDKIFNEALDQQLALLKPASTDAEYNAWYDKIRQQPQTQQASQKTWFLDKVSGDYYYNDNQLGYVYFSNETNKYYTKDANGNKQPADIRDDCTSKEQICINYIQCILTGNVNGLRQCVQDMRSIDGTIDNTIRNLIINNVISPSQTVKILKTFGVKTSKSYNKQYKKQINVVETFDHYVARLEFAATRANTSNDASARTDYFAKYPSADADAARQAEEFRNVVTRHGVFNQNSEVKELLKACIEAATKYPKILNPSLESNIDPSEDRFSFLPSYVPQPIPQAGGKSNTFDLSKVIASAYSGDMCQQGGLINSIINSDVSKLMQEHKQTGGNPALISQYNFILKQYVQNSNKNAKLLKNILNGTINELANKGYQLENEENVKTLIESYEENEEAIIKIIAHLRAYAAVFRNLDNTDETRGTVDVHDLGSENKTKLVEEYKRRESELRSKLDRAMILRGQYLEQAGLTLSGLVSLNQLGVPSGPVVVSQPPPVSPAAPVQLRPIESAIPREVIERRLRELSAQPPTEANKIQIAQLQSLLQ